MIGRINFCRSFYKQIKCQTVAASVSTSAVSYNKKEKKYFSELKEKFDRDKDNYENTFGNIEHFETKFLRIKDDPEDILEYEQLKAAPGKSLMQYIEEIKSLLERNDYQAALKLFEIDMTNDRIRNKYFVYKMLIAYNGRLGNLKEAYRLFIDYKRRGNIVTGAIYTSMFNACANCKNSFLALEKAAAVEECMNKNEFHKINMSNYNVMMKAYGRHGDLAKCLKIIDVVLEKRGKINCDPYLFLLQACITDTNSGLRHALLVWRKMLQYRTKPNIFSFNLMLRCIRDCALGEVLLIPDAIKQIFKESKFCFKRKLKIEKIGSKEKTTVVKIPLTWENLKPKQNKPGTQEQFKDNLINLGSFVPNESLLISSEQKLETSESLMTESETENVISNLEGKDDTVEELNSKEKPLHSDFVLPNLLALKPTIGSVVEFGEMTTPQSRFMLVGGVDGILKTMAEFNIEPDLKTFTLMLSLVPSTKEAEERLTLVAESYNILLDTGFYNVLLKRRIFRKELHLIKDCLDQMCARNIKPDILTFGILAISCKTRESCIELLENLHKHGFRVNAEIISTLLNNALSSKDMEYVLTILRAAKEDEAQLDAKCLAKISFIVKQEKRRKRLENNTHLKSVDNEENTLLNEEIERAQSPFQV